MDGASSHVCGARANDLAIHAVEPDHFYYTPGRGVTASHKGEKILQQTMKRKFIRALAVVLAAFAVFVYVYPDDLWDDAAYTPSEMLTESSERLSTHRDRHAVYSALFAAASKSTSCPSSEARTMSPTLVSLSTCVLLC